VGVVIFFASYFFVDFNKPSCLHCQASETILKQLDAVNDMLPTIESPAKKIAGNIVHAKNSQFEH
jgi:hypothetical protein